MHRRIRARIKRGYPPKILDLPDEGIDFGGVEVRPERAAEDGEGVVDVVTVPVEVDEGAGGVVLVYVAGEGAETFGGFDLLVRRCERRWR